MAEGYYKVSDYQKHVNKSYEYHYTYSAPDPHSFTTGGKIVAGAYTAMVHNVVSTAKFGKGLITGESYGQAWSGLKSAGNFVNPWSEKGDTLRTQAYNWAANAKNWDAYDWSYGTTTVGLSLLTTKGMGATFKGLSFTTADGFLIGGITLKAPINISVQRFGLMSTARPDFWGLRIGPSPFINRTFVAIKPEWNNLTLLTEGTITKGTVMKIGIVGPQGWRYPGGLLQFIVKSKNVAKQTSKAVN